jgi:nucleotide-binding universal stress UspA family protein
MPMLPYRTILVPTDFSDNALTATEFAFDLANRTDSTVILLHVLHLQVAQSDMDAMVLIERNNEKTVDAYNSLAAIVETLKVRFPKVKAKPQVRQGFLIETITSEVLENNADLVIMGTKGASGIKEYLVGSNTVKVIDHTAVPVFAIPNDVVQKPFSKILFATDFEFDDIEALEDLAEFAKIYDAEINVVHVSDSVSSLNGNDEGRVDYMKEICEQRIHYPKIKFGLVVQKESTLETLQLHIKEYGADMVCLSASGKGFFQRLFSGNLTHKMAYHTDIPFLAFHIKVPHKL